MRDLHSIDKRRSEDSVMYPQPFTEEDDEKKLKEKHERQMESERLECEKRERKKRLKKEESAEQIEKNKECTVPVEETRRCVKNADVCVNCDPDKDCRETSLKSDWTN